MTTIKLRRDTTADWTAANPVLAEGEPGLDLDTDMMKIGDGVTPWLSLPVAFLTPTAADSRYEAGGAKIVYVHPSGSDALSNGKTASAPKATISAAVASLAGNTGEIRLLDGVHDVGNGLSLSGARCSIVGFGAGMRSTGAGIPEGSVIKASTQSGPVLDFTGYIYPHAMRGRVEFGNFAVQGSGAADPTKVNVGIKIGSAATVFAAGYFHDIAISNTGGPGMEIQHAYLADFERITVVQPIGASTNDVPYMLILGSNGNRFRGIGFRNVNEADIIGVSGALVVTSSSVADSNFNVWDGTWTENLRCPTNGVFFSFAGNRQYITGTQFFDSYCEPGATNTAWVKFAIPPVGANYGGNLWHGYVPGRTFNTTVQMTYGIRFEQNNNAANGPKGYVGYNAYFALGVKNTVVTLTGSESTATDPAFVDESGNRTNICRDDYTGVYQEANYGKDSRTTANGGAGPRFWSSTTPLLGTVWLGTTGVKVGASDKIAIVQGDELKYQDTAGVLKLWIQNGLMRLQGGTSRFVQTKTANYTVSLTADDVIIADGTSITITLPSAVTAGVGRSIRVKNVNATSCTIATTSSQTIDGAAPTALAQWAVGHYVSNGAAWVRI
jgi:hypothetical protein